MKKELGILDEFIESKGLRHTSQRRLILDTFLSTERHLSVDELYKLIKRKDRSIGYTTVYRAMKLFSEFGLCQELDFGDGILRYEHKYGHQHHDHLICIKCGRFIEVMNLKIEKLQDNLAKEYRFIPLKHKLQIFGICKKCQRR